MYTWKLGPQENVSLILSRILWAQSVGCCHLKPRGSTVENSWHKGGIASVSMQVLPDLIKPLVYHIQPHNNDQCPILQKQPHVICFPGSKKAIATSYPDLWDWKVSRIVLFWLRSPPVPSNNIHCGPISPGVVVFSCDFLMQCITVALKPIVLLWHVPVGCQEFAITSCLYQRCSRRLSLILHGLRSPVNRH